MRPLFSKEALIDALWEEADYSAECVRDQLRTAEEMLHRARVELGFLMHQHHIDPDHIPPVGALLGELSEALNRSEEEENPLRWINTRPPRGELVGFRRRSS